VQAEHRYPEEKFIPVKPWRPCPICGRGDWCGYNSFIASCMRVSEGAFKEVILSNGQVAYLHWLKPGMVNLPALMKDDSITAAQTAPVEVRDRVYRDFLRLLYLHPRHREDLLRRGLTEWEIRRNGYRSVPETESPWSVCRRLIRMGHDLAGIPGFYKARGLRGGTYWTFDRQPGYFIPVRDEKGRIQALQRRMDDARGGKYKLFSGHKSRGGCSCGTPAHVTRPAKVEDRRIWITEGPLKADIACKYLGAVVVGALSAATWRPVIPVILALGVKEAVIAYDRDLETNPGVGRAYETLKAELKKHGLAVSRAVWSDKKGIDDALAAGMEVRVVRA
jgi:hypothetical protein